MKSRKQLRKIPIRKGYEQTRRMKRLTFEIEGEQREKQRGTEERGFQREKWKWGNIEMTIGFNFDRLSRERRSVSC